MSKEKVNERISRRDLMPETERKSHTGIIIVVALLATCLLGGVVVYLFFGKKIDESQYNVVITSDNIDEIIDQMENEEYIPRGSYEVRMNTKWEFPNGSSASSNAYVANVIENQSTVFFTIVLSDDKSREVYKSPYMAPGSHLENIKLDDILDAGTYQGVLTYHLVDDDYKETGTVSVKVTLTINN